MRLSDVRLHVTWAAYEVQKDSGGDCPSRVWGERWAEQIFMQADSAGSTATNASSDGGHSNQALL
jgi:hypothetical protein